MNITDDEVRELFAEAERPNWVHRDLFTLARLDAFRRDFETERLIVSGYRLPYGIERRSRWDRQDEDEAKAWIARWRRVAKLARRAAAQWRQNGRRRVSDATTRSAPYRDRPVNLAAIKQRKLSADTVRAIRREYAAGFCGFVKLGRRYGVSAAMISNIVHFDQYRDIAAEEPPADAAVDPIVATET